MMKTLPRLRIAPFCLRRIPCPNRREAFTLIELLVVVAILGLLLALLLPSLSRAHGQATRTQCLSNGRQVIIAWTIYAQDHGDTLAMNVDGMRGGFTNWVAGNMGEESDATDRGLLVDKNRSLIGPYITKPEIFKCPDDESQYVRSISMNCRMGPFRDPAMGPPRWISDQENKGRIFKKLGDVGLPARIFVTIDENSRSINDAYFAVDMSNTGEPSGAGISDPNFIIDYPAPYHSGGATVSFTDGHAILQRWTEESTVKNIAPQKHLSPASKDVAWLQEHCTYNQ